MRLYLPTAMPRARIGAVLAGVLAIASSGPRVGVAQVPSRYTTGREILKMDFASTALGDFPTGIKTLNGTMDVVEKDGMHMLRASSPSEVLVQLPQVLPEQFTIELDIVPKACCGPDDIAIEGTDTDHRGPATAQITWQTPRISVVGGAPDMYQAPMPDVLATSTPGVLTHLVLTVDHETIQLFTNGRRLYTLTDRKFARRNILWLMLGGADDGPNAMHLARLRIINNAVVAPKLAGDCPPGSADCVAATGGSPKPDAATTPPPKPPSPTSPTPPPSTSPTARLQSTASAPATNTPITTVRGSTTKPAGPDTIIAVLGEFPFGGGTVWLEWGNVTNATAYRVYCMPTATSAGVLHGTVTKMDALKTGVPGPVAVDLEICVKYWAEGVFADGSSSNPSPITDTRPSNSTRFNGGVWGPVTGLAATVSGTTNVTLVDGQQVRGSTVKWTWDTQLTDQPKPYVYWTTVQVMAPGTTALAPQLYHTERIRISEPAPFAILNDGGTPGPPFSMSFPAGTNVLFCVAPFPIADMVSAGRTSYGFGFSIACTSSAVPP